MAVTKQDALDYHRNGRPGKIEVVATRDRETKKFFINFKERLKTSLRQIDILITTHGIQVI